MEILESFRTRPPRGGLWKLKHPISGYEFSSHQLPALKDAIYRHEEANGYPITSDQDIESQLCTNHPASCGEPEAPRLLARAVNFISEMANWAKEGFPIASQEVLQERLDICQSCSYWRGTTGGSLVHGKCRKCGCVGLKLAVGSASCPLGKWLAV